MKYKVIISGRADAEIQKAFQWLVEQTPQHAVEWYNGIIDSLLSLEENPARCPLAPESRGSSRELRQLLYGHKRHAYRIVFAIQDDQVDLLNVRHAARKA